MRKTLRTLFYRMSPPMRAMVRRLVFWPVDLVEWLTGKRHPLVPPRGMIYTGSGDFLAQGRQFKEYFKRYAGLHPGSKVLDVGSGIGRMAVALTDELDPAKGGRYEGFDVIRTGVDWCTARISSRFPHFRFTYVPLRNDLYRSDGESAEQFVFPYPDAQFDLVILTSVFTHMTPEEVLHYLDEMHRVMLPAGRVLATFFLWNEQASRLSVDSGFSFPYDKGHYRLMDEKVQAANVAYDEKWLQQQINHRGFAIEQACYGSWCGRPAGEAVDFQDMLILKKL